MTSDSLTSGSAIAVPYSRVLIVDDEQSIRTSLRAFVEMDGHKVSLASNAAEALKLVQEETFDVVVTDIVLPRKTGIALLADIREIQPDLPVIMITGDPEIGTAAEAVRKDAFDYLSKPVSREAITKTVSAAIAKKTLLDKNRQLAEENRKHREQLEKLVEEKVQEVWAERDKLRSAFIAMKDGIYIVNQEHDIEFANAALVAELGPYEGLKCYAYIYNRKDVCPDCRNKQVWAGQSVQWEWTSSKSGKTYAQRDAPSKNADGSMSKLAILHDITERKRAEEKEREHYATVELLSETAIKFVSFPEDEGIYRYIGERIRELAGESLVVVNSIDESGDILTNRAICGLGKIAAQVAGIIGRDPSGMAINPQNEELRYLSDRKLHNTGKSLFQITQKAIPKTICAAIEKLYNIGTIYAIGLAREDRLLGTVIIILSKGQILKAPKIIEALVNQASTALQRKQAEESLRASEERFRTFFKNQPAFCYVISPETIILDVNETALNVLGYQKSELIGKPVSMIYASESARRHPELVARWKEQGQIRDEEMTLISKAGQERSVMLSADAVRDSEGCIQYAISVQIDITERKAAEQRLQDMLTSIIESMSLLVQVKDPYTAGHQNGVARLARAIAEKLQLGEEQAAGLHTAGLLHDIGKLAVPAEILSKPTTLTDTEFALIQAHAKMGYDILHKIDFPWPIAEIVLQHHERLDGSGYPQGLKAADGILLEARIIAVADVVEAMSSHRPYRPALDIEAALEEIERGSGSQYDAEVVTACHAVFADGFQLDDD